MTKSDPPRAIMERPTMKTSAKSIRCRRHGRSGGAATNLQNQQVGRNARGRKTQNHGAKPRTLTHRAAVFGPAIHRFPNHYRFMLQIFERQIPRLDADGHEIAAQNDDAGSGALVPFILHDIEQAKLPG